MAGAAGPASLQIRQLNSLALQTQPASNNHFLFTAACHRSLLTHLLGKWHSTKKPKPGFLSLTIFRLKSRIQLEKIVIIW